MLIYLCSESNLFLKMKSMWKRERSYVKRKHLNQLEMCQGYEFSKHFRMYEYINKVISVGQFIKRSTYY